MKYEIGDRWFAVLVDETRDASIKEQMVVVVRYIYHIFVYFICFVLIFSNDHLLIFCLIGLSMIKEV